MKRTQISDGIFQYCFNGDENTKIGYTIYALVVDKEALIIDTAYPHQAKQIRDDLESRGITVTKVVISHFHPDHIAGTSVFNDCEIIGSKYYKVNINNCKRWSPNYTYLEPNHLIKNQDVLEFGPFKLKFLSTPGHSNCSISTVINDEFIHVGDLLMTSDTGKPILPIVTQSGSYFEHIASLEVIKNANIDNLLLSHGHTIMGREKIHDEIDDRIFYLEKVQKSRGNIQLEDCLRNPLNNYECTEWHSTNVKYFKRFF